MEALKALELIEKLENDLCDMYEKLRMMFKGDPELFDLFDQLHLEEANHANLAGMQKRIVRARPKEFGEVTLNFTEIRKTMDHVEVVRAIPRERIDEILHQCFLIESSLADQYVVTALKESNQEMKQLLEMLGQGFEDHMARLASRFQDLGGDLAKTDTLRRYPRVPYSGKIKINENIAAKGVDISESGMFLQASRPFSDGSLVTVSFPMTGGIVTVEGIVTYSVPNAGFGLAFRDLSVNDLSLIRHYVDTSLNRIQQVELDRLEGSADDGNPAGVGPRG